MSPWPTASLHHVRAERRVALGGRAVGGPRLRDAAAQHLRVVGFADDDLRLRTLHAQHPRHALERPATAVARYPGVEPRALEVLEDLDGRRPGVHVGVRLVRELPHEEPAAVALGALDHAERGTVLDRAHGIEGLELDLEAMALT